MSLHSVKDIGQFLCRRPRWANDEIRVVCRLERIMSDVRYYTPIGFAENAGMKMDKDPHTQNPLCRCRCISWECKRQEVQRCDRKPIPRILPRVLAHSGESEINPTTNKSWACVKSRTRQISHTKMKLAATNTSIRSGRPAANCSEPVSVAAVAMERNGSWFQNFKARRERNAWTESLTTCGNLSDKSVMGMYSTCQYVIIFHWPRQF